jgi:hypothetical protein
MFIFVLRKRKSYWFHSSLIFLIIINLSLIINSSWLLNIIHCIWFIIFIIIIAYFTYISLKTRRLNLFFVIFIMIYRMKISHRLAIIILTKFFIFYLIMRIICVTLCNEKIFSFISKRRFIIWERYRGL